MKPSIQKKIIALMKKTTRHLGWLGGLLFFITSCAPSAPPAANRLESGDHSGAAASGAGSPAATATPTSFEPSETAQLPVRFQRPNYLLAEPTATQLSSQKEEKYVIQVGADISSTAGPVPLRDILRRLGGLKNMNISWASDVDQYQPVDVDIRAEDDFFKAIDDLLRQVDYFHEIQGNTIIVKYKETRKFHIAMPFLTTTYSTGVGGDVLGSAGESNIVGNIKMTSENNIFDVWQNISTNLDQILEIWSQPSPSLAPPTDSEDGQAAPPPVVIRTSRSGKGYYSIDRPVGMITVTAPRPLLEKAANYLENLKKQLYRQVSIEAKILEVTLDDGSSKGINWANVIGNVHVDFQVFGPQGIIYAPGTSERVISQVRTRGSLPFGDFAGGNPFTAIIDAIEQHGQTKVLANPKLSVMNGQPALISVGDNVRFIDKVESQAKEGVITYSVSTSSIMSGLGLSVVATIMDNDEVILNLTPVTSQLEEPMRMVTVGLGSVMLPRVRLREMSTMVRIKDGGMLVVGGLIDEADATKEVRVPMLGSIPVFKRFFNHESKTKRKTELIILLRPQIIL
jgi:MSHA type pilus biogenesis protein MshL